MKHSERPIIGFSDYCELHGNSLVCKTRMLQIKRMMMLPLKARPLCTSRFVRRRILSFGDPICCPSVCFNMDVVKTPIFREHFKSNEDWEAWEKLSKESGAFVYVPKILVAHRIHEGSITTSVLTDNSRIGEDEEMFEKFWPAPIAKAINHWYSKAEKYNRI